MYFCYVKQVRLSDWQQLNWRYLAFCKVDQVSPSDRERERGESNKIKGKGCHEECNGHIQMESITQKRYQWCGREREEGTVEGRSKKERCAKAYNITGPQGEN